MSMKSKVIWINSISDSKICLNRLPSLEENKLFFLSLSPSHSFIFFLFLYLFIFLYFLLIFYLIGNYFWHPLSDVQLFFPTRLFTHEFPLCHVQYLHFFLRKIISDDLKKKYEEISSGESNKNYSDNYEKIICYEYTLCVLHTKSKLWKNLPKKNKNYILWSLFALFSFMQPIIEWFSVKKTTNLIILEKNTVLLVSNDEWHPLFSIFSLSCVHDEIITTMEGDTKTREK